MPINYIAGMKSQITIPDYVHTGACKAAIKAGNIMLRYVELFRKLRIQHGEARFKEAAKKFVKYKDAEEKDPLTKADQRSHHLLLAELKKILPSMSALPDWIAHGNPDAEIPVISEENPEGKNQRILDSKPRVYWVIDGLDGTRTFYSLITKPYRPGYEQYSVNISLVVDGVPELGVLYFPSEKRIFFTQKDGSYQAYLMPGSDGGWYLQPVRFKDGSVGKVMVTYGGGSRSSLVDPEIVHSHNFIKRKMDGRKDASPFFAESEKTPFVIASGYGGEFNKNIAGLFAAENMNFRWNRPIDIHMLSSGKYIILFDALGHDVLTQPPRHNFDFVDCLSPNAGRFRDMVVMAREKDMAVNGELMLWDFAASHAIINKIPRTRLFTEAAFIDVIQSGNSIFEFNERLKFDYGSLKKFPPSVILFDDTLDKFRAASFRARLDAMKRSGQESSFADNKLVSAVTDAIKKGNIMEDLDAIIAPWIRSAVKGRAKLN